MDSLTVSLLVPTILMASLEGLQRNITGGGERLDHRKVTKKELPFSSSRASCYLRDLPTAFSAVCQSQEKVRVWTFCVPRQADESQ